MRKLKKIIKCAIAVTLLLCANLVYYVFVGQERSAEKLAQDKELSLYECVSAYQTPCRDLFLFPKLGETRALEERGI